MKSTLISPFGGNDTIDPYPLSCQGKLTKLLCISKERFEKLCLAARELLVNDKLIRSIPAQTQKVKLLCETPVLTLHSSQKTKHSAYIPTPIWQTHYSEFWQWQRVSEWHREYGQDEIINEKRHILL
jgi:hypothetical protein